MMQLLRNQLIYLSITFLVMILYICQCFILSFSSISYAQNPTNDLLFAVVNENLEGVRAAIQNGANPSANMRELLYDLNYYTTYDSVPSQLRDSARRDEAALHYAIRYYLHSENHLAIVEALINAEADVNALNLDDKTPLDLVLIREYKGFERDNAHLNILFVIDHSTDISDNIDRPEPPVRSMESEILTQIQNIPDFIKEAGRMLLAAGAKTQFDIEHAEWLHH